MVIVEGSGHVGGTMKRMLEKGAGGRFVYSINFKFSKKGIKHDEVSSSWGQQDRLSQE